MRQRPPSIDAETWTAITAIEWLSPTEAALILGVGVNTVTAQLRAGKLLGISSAGGAPYKTWLIPRDELRRYRKNTRPRGPGRPKANPNRTKHEVLTYYPIPSPEK